MPSRRLAFLLFAVASLCDGGTVPRASLRSAVSAAWASPPGSAALSRLRLGAQSSMRRSTCSQRRCVVGLRCVVPQSSDSDMTLEEFEEQLFVRADTDKSSDLSLEELKTVFANMGASVDIGVVRRLFEELDINKDGTVSLQEFKEGLQRLDSDPLQETELTNEQCEILDLPYGTKIVGEMDEFMIQRLTKKGTYEGSNPTRYFGNEKFRKKNYFGKQKSQVNVKRIAAKFRRFEIESRMDTGVKYEDAVKQVDSELTAGTLNPFAEIEAQEAAAQEAEAAAQETAEVSTSLPPGWQSAIDPTTGNTYYYTDQGVTQWNPPE